VSLTPVESVHFSEWSLLLRLNNLSIASRIYLLEPQWNPSVENQAIGRIFRLGQERPVTVVRYIVDKTIEDVSPEVILASVP
jgi:SNF2 family DNA or RNA helicase